MYSVKSKNWWIQDNMEIYVGTFGLQQIGFGHNVTLIPAPGVQHGLVKAVKYAYGWAKEQAE